MKSEMDEMKKYYEEIKCGVIEDLLPGYVDDFIGEKSRELVEYHLNICGNCRKKEKALRGELMDNKEKNHREKAVEEEEKASPADESSEHKFSENIKRKLFWKRVGSVGVLVLVAAYLMIGYRFFSRMVSFFSWDNARPFYMFCMCYGLASRGLLQWIILNILLFVPLGLFVPFLVPKMRKGPWVYFVGAIVSGGFMIWGGCFFFTDLLLCHLSGTMIGYGFFIILWAVVEKRQKKAVGVIRRRWWSVLLYQLPLLCICLLIAVPCLVYQQQELGHVTWEYPNFFAAKPTMEAACDLSDNLLRGMVYEDVPKDSLPDGFRADVEEDRVKISREYQGIANNYAYKEFPMISEKAAFEHFCESDMVDCRENFTKLVFYDVKIMYVTDTKGFYQPVYYFRGKADGEERNYVVPAIENP